MRIIISGGGTGGHIYPALTILDEIKRLCPDAEFLYVGTAKGLEADIVPKSGLPLTTVDIEGFSRSLSPKNILRAFKAGVGTLKAMNIVRQFKPDAAIGTGGYVCGPVILAAALLGVPTLIQEQNAAPGITNKYLSPLVTKVAAGTAEAAKIFPPSKTVCIGNPIRRAVMAAKRDEAIATLGLDPAKKTLLVSGGSRGARSINEAMIAVHAHFQNNPHIQILHITGTATYDAAIAKLKEKGVQFNDTIYNKSNSSITPHSAFCTPNSITPHSSLLTPNLNNSELRTPNSELKLTPHSSLLTPNLDNSTLHTPNSTVLPYLYDMPLALAAADLAVFRAGAIALAELTARGLPAILIPFPYATADHQTKNAAELVANGAAVMIKDSELTGEKLIEAIENLIDDETKLNAMAAASKAIGKPDAGAKIAELVLEIAKK